MLWSSKFDSFLSSFTPLTATPFVTSINIDVAPMDASERNSLVFNSTSDSASASAFGTGWASASFSGFASGSGSSSVSGSASAYVANDGKSGAKVSGTAAGEVTDVTASASAGDSFDFEAEDIDTSAFTVNATDELILIEFPDLGTPFTDYTVDVPEIDLSQIDLGFSGFDVDLSF